MASKEVVYQREFCFTTIREYFRTISGEEREGYNLLRDVGTQAQSPTSSLTQGVRRDSDYSSGSEPPVEKDDEEEPHWGALRLDQFKGCAGSYVDLYCLQLHLLAEWDYWTSNLLRFATIKAYVEGVPKDQQGTATCTKALYLTPDTVTGELYCSTRQPFEGPYHPENLNRLEVNYVLCSGSQSDIPILPRSFEVALFTAKFKGNYALAIPAGASSDIVDVKFIPIRDDQKKIKPKLPTIHCTVITTGDHSTIGAYNISIKANGHTYWLYLDPDDTGSRVVVRGFREDSLSRKPDKAKFNFPTALCP